MRAAEFVRRNNRFRAVVRLDGQEVAVHVPNSGRLGELLTPGAAVWVVPQTSAGRKTVGDLVLVEYAGTLVAVDARLPNRLVETALAEGRLTPFAAYGQARREVVVDHGRLDFLLTCSGCSQPVPRCWLEVKSVTLVEDGTALFPDAPTERAVRHLEALSRLHAGGDRAAVLFVVQRQDARGFAPHPTADPAFAAALRRAHSRGVEVYAWRCQVDLAGSRLSAPIPVALD